MDKLDSYGDNFRNVPICVPNETEKDAQAFKEKIANRSFKSVHPYFQDGKIGMVQTKQTSRTNDSLLTGTNISSWTENYTESGETWNSILSYGHKKTKKLKKAKKESKR